MAHEAGMMVQIEKWTRFPWLRHGFSTRFGGISTVYAQAQQVRDLNLGWTRDDDPANVLENRRRLVAAITTSLSETSPLITVQQIHSAINLVIPEVAAQPLPASVNSLSDFVSSDGRALLEGDGLMTNASGILLGIQTADCVPVFVVDTRLRAVANFHAGWRGTAARIVEHGVAKMANQFGSRPEDLMAAVGPSIGVCCYTVGCEVRQAFTSQFAYGEDLFTRVPSQDGPLHLDLWEANRRQLLESGVSPERIALVGECTGCSGLPGRRRYFSHRCEHGFTGRMLNVIGVAWSKTQ